MADFVNPLTEDDLTKLNQALNDLDRADAVIQRAKQAGLDVTADEERSRETRTKLRKIKQAFFPAR